MLSLNLRNIFCHPSCTRFLIQQPQGYIYGLHSGAEADVGAASLDRLRESAAGSYGLIIDADSALCLMCEDRDLALVRDSSLSTTAQLAFGYRKDFPLKGRMDGLILRYFADGTMGRFRKRWFKSCEPNSQPATGRTARQPTAFGKDRTRTHSFFPHSPQQQVLCCRRPLLLLVALRNRRHRHRRPGAPVLRAPHLPAPPGQRRSVVRVQGGDRQRRPLLRRLTALAGGDGATARGQPLRRRGHRGSRHDRRNAVVYRLQGGTEGHLKWTSRASM